MGTIIDPAEPGIICANCWGPDKPFAGQVTPKRVVVRVRANLPGQYQPYYPEARCNGDFVLEQVEACRWLSWFGQTQVELTYGKTYTYLDVRYFYSTSYAWCFGFSGVGPCALNGYNLFISYQESVWYGGYAGVDWGH